jgi:hypothetical protein
LQVGSIQAAPKQLLLLRQQDHRGQGPIFLLYNFGEFESLAITFRRSWGFSTAVTPPAPAAKNLGVNFRRPCRAGVWQV